LNGLIGLRIGLVGPLPPPSGGMAMQTEQLARLLREAGARVQVVQSNAPYSPVLVGSVPLLRALFRLVPYLLHLWRLMGRSDVVHVMANSGWSWHLVAAPALWIAKWRGVPAVVNYRGGEARTFLKQHHRSVRWSLRHAAALCVPSGFLRAVFAEHGFDASVVPNAVDTLIFEPRDAPCSVAHVVVTRNLEPIYGLDTALRAFAQVRAVRPDATMTIAGTGPLESSLKDLAASLGVMEHVIFAGRLDRQGVAAALRRSAVSLNPSLVDNMPNSVLEAMASGVPVVSTDVGGVPYMVKHDVTALLVPPRHEAAMAQAILRVLNDEALAARLSQSALREVQRYTWPHIAPLWSGAYSAALKRTTGDAACTHG
jgi:glycosyltransferase involved in cell wall biosynthesis